MARRRSTKGVRRSPTRIVVTSVLIDDQEKALRFYTDVLGFVKKSDTPLGDGTRC